MLRNVHMSSIVVGTACVSVEGKDGAQVEDIPQQPEGSGGAASLASSIAAMVSTGAAQP